MFIAGKPSCAQGYGIRILRDYVDSLLKSEEERKSLSTKANKLQRLDVYRVADNARVWTDRIVARYLDWGYRNRLHYLYGYKIRLRPEFQGSRVPVFTHLLLDTRCQNTEEPGARSCLTGFEYVFGSFDHDASIDSLTYDPQAIYASCTSLGETVCGRVAHSG